MILGCCFLGTKSKTKTQTQTILGSIASSIVGILGYSQCSMDTIHRHLTGNERDMWSHVCMSWAFDLQPAEISLGYSCPAQEMSPWM